LIVDYKHQDYKHQEHGNSRHSGKKTPSKQKILTKGNGQYKSVLPLARQYFALQMSLQVSLLATQLSKITRRGL
jgi:hypothetical protein